MPASGRHNIYSVNEVKRAQELSMIGAIASAVGLREPSGDERYFSLREIARKVGAILTLPAIRTLGMGWIPLRASSRFAHSAEVSHR